MTEPICSMEELLENLHVPLDGWDLVLAGDGSGSQWNNPGGWACIMAMRDRQTGKMRYLSPFVGAVSHGPINWLETMPYWHCLRHHYHDLGGQQLCDQGGVDVHIVSDSEWVVKTMSGRWGSQMHGDMVVLFSHYRSLGYRIRWHHRRRDVVALNTIADRLSVNAREYIGLMEYPEISEEFPPRAEPGL